MRAHTPARGRAGPQPGEVPTARRMDQRRAPASVLDLAPQEARRLLGDWLAGRGESAYRVNQVVPRLWQHPVRSWRAALELPAGLRAALDDEWPLPALALGVRQESRDGTVKFLWRLPDGEAIESVLIPEGARRTLCISSQAGCPLKCAFCATGTMGLHRNLAAWEIAAQVRELQLLPDACRPTNVVFMGMGEPLLNWGAVGPALTILNDREGLGIGARHITVSTVGIVPAMAELAKRAEQFRLAISLHAPASDTRLSLMPIERRYRLTDVLDAAAKFKRRVTFEYVLIDGVNDRDLDAALLAKLARAAGAMVNLLPLHPGGSSRLAPSPGKRMRAFAAELRRRGVEAVVRRSRGLDIAAACGQLRIAEQRGEIATQPDRHVHEPAGVRSAAHEADT